MRTRWNRRARLDADELGFMASAMLVSVTLPLDTSEAVTRMACRAASASNPCRNFMTGGKGAEEQRALSSLVLLRFVGIQVLVLRLTQQTSILKERDAAMDQS